MCCTIFAIYIHLPRALYCSYRILFLRVYFAVFKTVEISTCSFGFIGAFPAEEKFQISLKLLLIQLLFEIREPYF